MDLIRQYCKAFCSTTSCPVVHAYATYWFFLLETFALVINVSSSPDFLLCIAFTVKEV